MSTIKGYVAFHRDPARGSRSVVARLPRGEILGAEGPWGSADISVSPEAGPPAGDLVVTLRHATPRWPEFDATMLDGRVAYFYPYRPAVSFAEMLAYDDEVLDEYVRVRGPLGEHFAGTYYPDGFPDSGDPWLCEVGVYDAATADEAERIGSQMQMPQHMVEIVQKCMAMQDAAKQRALYWLEPRT